VVRHENENAKIPLARVRNECMVWRRGSEKEKYLYRISYRVPKKYNPELGK